MSGNPIKPGEWLHKQGNTQLPRFNLFYFKKINPFTPFKVSDCLQIAVLSSLLSAVTVTSAFGALLPQHLRAALP